MRTQVCKKCGLCKGDDEYSVNKARLDGKCCYCKPCNATASAKRRKTLVPVKDPTVSYKVRLWVEV